MAGDAGSTDFPKHEIIRSGETQKHYLEAQKLSLERRLDQIRVDPRTETEIEDKEGLRLIRDEILGLLPITKLIRVILKWNEEVDKDFREAKKEALLNHYFDLTDGLKDSVAKLKALISDPSGNTLFNKIMNILGNSPPDYLLVRHLGHALKKIATSDFQKLFEKHKYALSQIERLSPQALSILADCHSWPPMRLGSFEANGRKIESDWLPAFVNAYASAKGIFDRYMIERVSHAVNELQRDRFVDAWLVNQPAQGRNTAVCKLTTVGSELLEYLDNGAV
jgi:hypothetical protein